MRRFSVLFVVPLLASIALAGEVVEAPHVRVEYTGITPAQARALAETLSAARQLFVDEFKLPMPPTIVLSVQSGPKHPARLYTDGNDRMFLSLPDASKLAPPQRSGVFNLYGMCHEAGHIGMYRTLTQRGWLSRAGAEGWAHYAGSVVVDRLFDIRGAALWFEPYDYRADGTARLDRSLAGNASDIDRAADQWRKLEAIIGRDGFARLFSAWQQAEVPLTEPAAVLLQALKQAWPDKSEALQEWWAAASPLLVEDRPASAMKPQTIDRSKLSGQPVTLKWDDDSADGRRSIAGGGHAVRFDAPDAAGEWYLSAISVHGSRYGPAKAPGTLFTIALCDLDMRVIQTWRKPYASFERGELKWVRLELPPTRVPGQFYVCLDFSPSASSGIYVGLDSSIQNHSQIARPGKPGKPLDAGDWMIRAEVDAPRAGGPTTR